MLIRQMFQPQLKMFEDDLDRQRRALSALMFESQDNLADFISLSDTYDKHDDWETWRPDWSFKYSPPPPSDSGHDNSDSVSARRQ